MNIIIITTSSDPFSRVFWKSYLESGGLVPKGVIFLPERKDLDYPFFKKVLVSFFLFGIIGSFRLLLMKRESGHSLLEEKGSKFYYSLDVLKDLEPDIVVSVGAPIVFKKEFLEVPRLGALNIHNGLLPKYRGHFGTFWEVYNNEKKGYVCLHKMEEKVDCGKIVAFDYLEVKKPVNLLVLLIEKKIRGAKLLAKVLRETQKQGIIFQTEKKIKEKNNFKNYFPWPSFKDILKFRLQLFKFKLL